MCEPGRVTVDPGYDGLLALALDIATEAGELLLHRPVDLGVDTKSTPTDVVTVMDKASEKLIVGRLRSERPRRRPARRRGHRRGR